MAALSLHATITSGNALYGDLTAVYKIGKWSVGPVGYFEVQTTTDSGSAAIRRPASTSVAIIRPRRLGGLIGYDFGPVDLQVWVTDSSWARRSAGPGGLNVWSRIGFKIWGPDAPAAPLVTKN